MVEALWGKNARVSKVVPTQGRRRRGQKPEEVSAYTPNVNKSYAIRHICYHTSMVSKGIVGILDVDKKIDIMFVTNPQEKRKGVGVQSQGCALHIEAERWFLFGRGSSSGCCNESCGCGGRQHRGGRKIDRNDEQ